MYLQDKVWYPVQSVFLFLLTSLALLAAYLFLPETKGQPVPETEEETTHPVAPPPAEHGVDDGIVILRTGWRTLRHRYALIVNMTFVKIDIPLNIVRLCGVEYSDDEEDERRIVGDENNSDEQDHYWQDDPVIPPSPPDAPNRSGDLSQMI